MNLCTERLLLRPVEMADVDRLYEIYGNPDTNGFNPAGPYPHRDHAQQVLSGWIAHWQHHGFGNWAISQRDIPSTIIGFGGLSVREFAGKRINNLGYRFDVTAWGQGFATEFCRCVVAFGFDTCQLNTISAATREDHRASQRVLEKAGLQWCERVVDRPDAPASQFYQLTSDHWQRLQGSPK